MPEMTNKKSLAELAAVLVRLISARRPDLGSIVAFSDTPNLGGAVAASDTPNLGGAVAASDTPNLGGAVAASDTPNLGGAVSRFATMSDSPEARKHLENWIAGKDQSSGTPAVLAALETLGADTLAEAILVEAILAASELTQVDLGSHAPVAKHLGKALARSLSRCDRSGGLRLRVHKD